ncbi:MAG: 50S ribosomal protein L30 [Spirochaetia bacterium]
MAAKKAASLKSVQVELVRSVIGCKPNQRATVRALGLGKLHSKRTVELSPQVIGMIRVVDHLVSVKEIG